MIHDINGTRKALVFVSLVLIHVSLPDRSCSGQGSLNGEWESVVCDQSNIPGASEYHFPQVFHAALLHTGDIFMFGRAVFDTSGFGVFHPGSAGDLNPCSGSSWTQVSRPPPPTDPCSDVMVPWCGGHVFDRHGNVIILSGQEVDTCATQPSHTPTSRRALRFNSADNTWDVLPEMNSRRWYPTVSTHSTGEIIAWNGFAVDNPCPGCPNPPHEASYKPEWLAADASGSWTQDAGRCYGATTGGVGSYSPAVRHPATGNYVLASTQQGIAGSACTPATNPPTYFTLFRHDTHDVALQIPFVGGSCSSEQIPSSFAGNHGDGPHVILPMKAPIDPGPDANNGSWLWIGGYDGLYYLGCDNFPTNQVDLYDAATKTWTADDPMSFERMWPNAVLLPDGTILVHGGGDVCWPKCHSTLSQPGPDCSQNPPVCPQGYDEFGCECAQLTAEIYTPTNPPGKKWRKVAKALRPRNYHAVALLIPDGRVIVAGGEYQTKRCSFSPVCNPIARGKTIEFYKPPYFFVPGRPEIIDVNTSAAVEFGGSLVFTVNESIASAGKVILLRPSSVTHSVNMTQQIVELPFTETVLTSGSEYEVTCQIPRQSANLMPPGWEMLWVVDNEGLPAVQAKWIMVGIAPLGVTASPLVPHETAITLSGSNPFNPATAWKLDLATASLVDLRVYDAEGRLVRKVVSDHLGAGVHTLRWDGRNDEGHIVASGVYFWYFDGTGLTRADKFVVLK